ncbi:MAG: type II toxin-antitoxin system VapC family toxin [Chloroflexi bacterium]|nr:type II toxin-antitoxin system VapC family toxin [Chloroflexota bacterium]
MAPAELNAALGDATRVLLDTSTLIAFHNPLEQVHPLAKYLLWRIERDDDPLQGYYSVVSATELLVRPIRSGVDRFTFVHTFLTTFPHLTVLPMDLAVTVQAATVRAATGVRVPDAVAIASGLLAGCEAIVSNDEQWKVRLAPIFRRFRWVYLSDYL